jgi:hypothetical protein
MIFLRENIFGECKCFHRTQKISCGKIRIIEMNTENIMQFQGGGCYTEHGQRIAALAVDGGVYMSDKCRGLAYFFPACHFDQSEIMRRYHYNDNGKYSTPSVDAFISTHGRIALMELMHKGQ